MMKKALYTLALISCFLGLSSITGCTDGIFSLRGYIPEENAGDEMVPPPQTPPPESQKVVAPAFIDRILNETQTPPAPKPLHPPQKHKHKHKKHKHKKPPPDLLDAS
jgi:hypothetical protein